jgi:Protein of unknown function (DUF2586)
MTYPSVNVAVKDGGLGVVVENINGVVAIVGIASAGPTNQATIINDSNVLKSTFGRGPLVEKGLYKLELSGGPLVAVRINGSVAGTFSAVTKTGTGLSVLTLTGSTPLDDLNFAVKIAAGGASPATAAVTFQYSLDGGLNYSALIALPASGVYVVPGVGVTLNFSAATLVAEDVYSFTTSAPGYTNTELGLALDAAFSSSQLFPLIQVEGTPSNASALQATFILLASKLTAAANGQIPGANFGLQMFARGAIQCISDTVPNITTAVATLADTRVAIVAGEADVLSFFDATVNKRSALSLLMAKAASLSAGTDVAKFQGGLVRGVTKLYGEENAKALDNIGLSTMRRHAGEAGFYVGNFRLKSPSGSDFRYLQHGRVMDNACRVVGKVLLKFLNTELVLEGGLLSEKDAGRIKEQCTEAVVEAVVRNRDASEAVVTIDRTQNVLSTDKIIVKVAVTPLGYAKQLVAEVGFVNPRFAAA